MNLPPALLVSEQTATIFTGEAKMIYQDKVIPYKDNEGELSSRLSNRLLAKPWVNQLYFEVNTVEEGVNVICGRGRFRALVKVIKIDEKRKWCTVQYISGKQKTISVNSCKMEKSHLVPIDFRCYESIQDEIKVFHGNRPEGFKADYLTSDNYEAREHAGAIYAFRKESSVVEPKQAPEKETENTEITKDRYLGDGVYASFDGYQIWLAVNDHKNKVVAIDSHVADALIDYISELKNRRTL